ncbi:MAG TPA: tetratricopeptide repeat protein, partial [Blastocatellia bacterium]
AELKQAEQLDPISFVIQGHIGWLHYYAGRYDLAIDRYQKVLEMEPNYAWARMHLSQAYEQKGMYSEAIAELQKALALSTNSHRYLARLGRLYAVSGNRLEAQKLLNQLLEMEKERYVSPYSLALVYSGLNDRERALDWLRKGLDQRAGRMVRLQFDPRFSNLRSEPEFERILRRINPSVQAAVFSMSAVNSR